MSNTPDVSILESSLPCEWGLSGKFDQWRPGQAGLVQDILDCPTVYQGRNSPAGSGKSPSYVLAAKLSGARTVILTATKALQSQLIGDFADTGMVDVRGKSNYNCVVRPGLTCEEASAVCKAGSWGQCPHRQAVEAACKAPLVVTNYATWLNRNRMSRGACAFTRPPTENEYDNVETRPFDMLVLDEAHTAIDELSDLVAVDLTNEDMTRYIRSAIPDHTLPMEEWKKYANEFLPVAKLRVTDMEAALNKGVHMDNQALKEFNHLARVVVKLDTLAKCKPDMWTVEPYSHGFRFDPVWPGAYSRYLFQDIPKIVFMSATIRPKTLTLLGLKDDQFTFGEYPSPFNPNDAPIYHVPTVRVWHGCSAAELSLMYTRTDEIIGSRLDRKGLVHSVSYKRALEILHNSRWAKHMMTNSRGYGAPPTADVVAKFMEADPPTYFVTPSVTTGYDFHGSYCETNIIPKLSVPDQRSTIMKERLRRDPEYGDYLTIQDLVQACGRGNRFIGDRCQTLITDDSIRRYLYKRRHLFPKYFFDFFRTSSVVPKPLPLMPVNQRRIALPGVLT